MDQSSNNKSPQLQVKRIVCEHCGNPMRVRVPMIPNKYKVTCPSCSHKTTIEVPATPGHQERKVLRSDILDDRVVSRQNPMPQAGESQSVPPILPKIPGGPVVSDRQLSQEVLPDTGGLSKLPVLGTPVRYKDSEKLFIVRTKAVVDKPYKVVCPKCGNDIKVLAETANVVVREKCSHCGITVAFKAVEKKALDKSIDDDKTKKPNKSSAHDISDVPKLPDLPKPQDDMRPTISLNTGGQKKAPTFSLGGPKGMLVWKTGSLMRRTKTKGLKEGSNTIGRSDAHMPSTVMIEGDPEMSRRSAEINVVRVKGVPDYVYTFSIIKSTNPIFINGRPIGFGNKVRLNYGDTICMGRTTILFDKRKDAKK